MVALKTRSKAVEALMQIASFQVDSVTVCNHQGRERASVIRGMGRGKENILARFDDSTDGHVLSPRRSRLPEGGDEPAEAFARFIETAGCRSQVRPVMASILHLVLGRVQAHGPVIAVGGDELVAKLAFLRQSDRIVGANQRRAL